MSTINNTINSEPDDSQPVRPGPLPGPRARTIEEVCGTPPGSFAEHVKNHPDPERDVLLRRFDQTPRMEIATANAKIQYAIGAWLVKKDAKQLHDAIFAALNELIAATTPAPTRQEGEGPEVLRCPNCRAEIAYVGQHRGHQMWWCGEETRAAPTAPPEPTDGQGEPTDSEMLDWLEKMSSTHSLLLLNDKKHGGVWWTGPGERHHISAYPLRSALRTAMKGESIQIKNTQ